MINLTFLNKKKNTKKRSKNINFNPNKHQNKPKPIINLAFLYQETL